MVVIAHRLRCRVDKAQLAAKQRRSSREDVECLISVAEAEKRQEREKSNNKLVEKANNDRVNVRGGLIHVEDAVNERFRRLGFLAHLVHNVWGKQTLFYKKTHKKNKGDKLGAWRVSPSKL